MSKLTAQPMVPTLSPWLINPAPCKQKTFNHVNLIRKIHEYDNYTFKESVERYSLPTTRVPAIPARVTGMVGRPGVVEGVLRPVKIASAPTTAAADVGK